MARQQSKRARLRRAVRTDKHRLLSRLPDCPSGKRRHKTEERALEALRRRKAKSKDGGPVRVYRCHLCRGWHLTSKPKREE